jgi:anti-sigma factor RsiW
MNGVRHRRYQRSLGAYLDGELDPRSAERVAAHLDECWGCSGDAQLLRSMKASLQNFARRLPPDLTSARLRRWATNVDSWAGQ